jgi:hypothetical protein
MKQLSLICLSFAALAGASHAAEPEIPNILGTWKPSAGAYTRSGTETKKSPPAFFQQPLQNEIRFLEQKGRSFHGVTKSANGAELHLAGVISRDGKSFVISADKGIGTGTIEGGKIEYCGATSSMQYNLAFCSTLEKVK